MPIDKVHNSVLRKEELSFLSHGTETFFLMAVYLEGAKDSPLTQLTHFVLIVNGKKCDNSTSRFGGDYTHRFEQQGMGGSVCTSVYTCIYIYVHIYAL